MTSSSSSKTTASAGPTGAPAIGTGVGTRIVNAMCKSLGPRSTYRRRNPGTAARLVFSAKSTAPGDQPESRGRPSAIDMRNPAGILLMRPAKRATAARLLR